MSDFMSTLTDGFNEIQSTSVAEFANELKALNDAYKAKIRSEGERVLKSAFAGIFEQHPNLAGVRWQQYTPYFNDGDECTFYVHGHQYKITDADAFEDPDEEYEDGWSESLTYRKYVELSPEDQLLAKTASYYDRPQVEGCRVYAEQDYNRYIRDSRGYGGSYEYTGRFYIDAPIPNTEVIEKDVNQIFSIPDEVFKDVFGDHSEITVTRDGIEITEYDHD